MTAISRTVLVIYTLPTRHSTIYC